MARSRVRGPPWGAEVWSPALEVRARACQAGRPDPDPAPFRPAVPMSKLLPVLALLLSLLALSSCSGLPRQGEAVGDVVTLGTLRSGSKMAQQSTTGRSWSIELRGADLILTDGGVVVEFRGAGPGGALDYQYTQSTSTWDFLVAGGVVHWHGHEIRVGDTTYDLTEPGEFVFRSEDWVKGE